MIEPHLEFSHKPLKLNLILFYKNPKLFRKHLTRKWEHPFKSTYMNIFSTFPNIFYFLMMKQFLKLTAIKSLSLPKNAQNFRLSRA